MHSIGSDLICMWTAAVVLCFASLMFGSVSIQDKENMITSFGLIFVVLVGAVFVTVGQLFGWIGVW